MEIINNALVIEDGVKYSSAEIEFLKDLKKDESLKIIHLLKKYFKGEIIK